MFWRDQATRNLHKLIDRGDEALQRHVDQQIKSVQNELTEHKLDAERTVERLSDRVDDKVDVHSYDLKHTELERRITRIELWQSNVTGRAIGLGVVGAIFIAVATAVATHLIGGG